VSRRYSPRPAPGRCRLSAECCRLLIEAAALTALELEARGEMSPFARDVLGTLGDVGERGLGTDGKEPPPVLTDERGESPSEKRKEGKK